MEAYQERIVEEKKGLDKKLNSLSDFFLTKTFESLKDADKELLINQELAMMKYSRILDERITRF